MKPALSSIFFVHHGESEANADGIVAGSQLDSPLTERGKAQASASARILTSKSIDRIVSSPLRRASETASIISDSLSISRDQMLFLNEFSERNLGSLSGVRKEVYSQYERKHTVPNGESEQEMLRRVKRGLEELAELGIQNLVLVSHDGVFRMMKVILENFKMTDFSKIDSLANGGIYEFKVKGKA